MRVRSVNGRLAMFETEYSKKINEALEAVAAIRRDSQRHAPALSFWDIWKPNN